MESKKRGRSSYDSFDDIGDVPSSSASVPTTSRSRCIIHFDLDAFYCACERELNPSLKNRPLGVSQYNPHGDLSDLPPESVHRIVTEPASSMVEQKKKKEKKTGKNNGSLIAVSYEARAANVRRGDRGLDASKKCPELVIVQVPVKHGKADLTIYRSASRRVVKKLVEGIKRAHQEICQDLKECNELLPGDLIDSSKVYVEKASIDEIYVDVSDAAHVLASAMMSARRSSVRIDLLQSVCKDANLVTTVGGMETSNSVALATNSLSKRDVSKGSSLQVLDSASGLDSGSQHWWNRSFNIWSKEEFLLACGAEIATRARKHVFTSLGFTLSAGISGNKTLAKLASGLKKPNRQTLVNPHDAATLEKLFHPLMLDRIRGLGGKFGNEVTKELKVTTVGELAKVPLTLLRKTFPDRSEFLFEIAQGICKEDVSERVLNKSVGCGKNFSGPNAIRVTDKSTLRKWTSELSLELEERLSFEEDENNRVAKLFVLSLTLNEFRTVSRSSACPRNLSNLAEIAFNLSEQIFNEFVPKCRAANSSVLNISMSGTNFITQATGNASIRAAFERQTKNGHKSFEEDGKDITNNRSSRYMLEKKHRALKETSPRKKKLSSWFSQQSSPSTGKKHLPRNDYSIDASQIDPDVLKELPDDIRKSILKETKLKAPRRTIKSFFL